MSKSQSWRLTCYHSLERRLPLSEENSEQLLRFQSLLPRVDYLNTEAHVVPAEKATEKRAEKAATQILEWLMNPFKILIEEQASSPVVARKKRKLAAKCDEQGQEQACEERLTKQNEDLSRQNNPAGILPNAAPSKQTGRAQINMLGYDTIAEDAHRILCPTTLVLPSQVLGPISEQEMLVRAASISHEDTIGVVRSIQGDSSQQLPLHQGGGDTEIARQFSENLSPNRSLAIPDTAEHISSSTHRFDTLATVASYIHGDTYQYPAQDLISTVSSDGQPTRAFENDGWDAMRSGHDPWIGGD